MSSRALRRLQREEEERRQAEILQQDESQNEEAEDKDNDEVEPQVTTTQKNAFDFLNATAEDEEFEDDNDPDEQVTSTTLATSMPSAPKKSKKKSKKKRKKNSKVTTPEPEEDQGLDEIDLALKSLNTELVPHGEQDAGTDADLRAFYELLSTDSRHLNPLNEMRKLFGSAVLEGDRETNTNRRRGRGPTHLDLGAALTGRHSQVSRGQGLVGLALRRNIFMLGKEEWPKATSGGLGMEVVEEASDYTIEYRFVHSNLYQTVQRQFDLCVASMDPQRMISHLQLNPYHISTLLQVSEIAKHQGDHAVAVDLLERALFTFGRSVHSTFNYSMAHGRARLDFRRPENREFWLAAYRYIGTLGQRGTWRTAFEWAKLLLSLDPEQDPFSMRLTIDQLALRGAQFETLVKLAETPTVVLDWGQTLPNVQLSLSMAYYKLKRLNEASDAIRKVILREPWFVANLCKELSIEPLPKAVWGWTPRTPREDFYTQSYGIRAKDIWNTPEALAFLKSVVESAPHADPLPVSANIEDQDLTLAENRYVLLSEIPTLMAFLPRNASLQTSASDPLPPEDEIRSYNINSPEPTREEWEEELEADQREAAGLRSWFGNIFQRLGINITGADERDEAAVEQVSAALESSGLDINEIARRASRMEELQDRQAIAERRLLDLQQEQPASNILQDFNQEAPSSTPESPVQRRLSVSPAPELIPLQASVEEVADDDAPGPSNSDSVEQPLLTSNTGYDDDANQRWLAGRGMLRLKEFIANHGSDENAWKDDLNVDITPATEYAHRITQLKNRSSREFILNYALKQGAGAAASDLIRRLLA